MNKEKLITYEIENLDGECSLMKLRKMGNLYSGSKPLKISFKEMKELGIEKVIDLKSKSETPLDEEQLAKEAGLEYINIEVNGAGNISAELAEKISQEVQEQKPTLVYCASANRVPAWLGITLATDKVAPSEEILKICEKMGMDKEGARVAVENYINNIS